MAKPMTPQRLDEIDTCGLCMEDKPIVWWYENGETAVCAECHEEELLERDQLRAALARERQRIDAALVKHIEAPSAHGDTSSYCAHDGFTYPCATVRALTSDGQDTP